MENEVEIKLEQLLNSVNEEITLVINGVYPKSLDICFGIRVDIGTLYKCGKGDLLLINTKNCFKIKFDEKAFNYVNRWFFCDHPLNINDFKI